MREKNMISLDILQQISNYYPRAISTYILCYGNMDDNREISFTKKQITDDFSEGYCRFKNNLKALARIGLIEWHEMEDKIHVIVGDNESL